MSLSACPTRDEAPAETFVSPEMTDNLALTLLHVNYVDDYLPNALVALDIYKIRLCVCVCARARVCVFVCGSGRFRGGETAPPPHPLLRDGPTPSRCS